MNKEAPITEEIYQGLIRPRIFSNPDDDDLDPYTSWQGYGAGFESYFYRGHMVVQHDGLISGFSTVHFFVPEFKVGGAFFGNSVNAASVGSGILLKEIIDEILQVPKSDRVDWNARQHKLEDQYKEKQEKEREELRKELSADGDGETQPQQIPLKAYVGEYWNAGYKIMTVQIKDDRLFIDASDRSMGFHLHLQHISGQTHYIGSLYDSRAALEYVDDIRCEFRFDESKDQVLQMGLSQEPDLDGLIWYDKMERASVKEQRTIPIR